jgi:hypothetical protein
MDEPMRKEYANIARKNFAPLGLYAKDADGQKRLWELMALVADEAGIP